MKVLLLFVSALPFICAVRPGGQKPLNVDITDPNVVFAVTGINEVLNTNGDSRPRVAEKIISATSQVVSGLLYRFKIQVSGGDSTEVCDVAVWRREWLVGSDRIKIEGTPKCVLQTPASAHRVGGMVGGEHVAIFSDPDVQNAVQYLESRLNAKSNSLYYLKATGASKVTTQVVNGVNYRFSNINFAQSTCTKHEVKQNRNTLCTVNANTQPVQTCSYVVYWNPRQKEQYTISKEDCNIPV